MIKEICYWHSSLPLAEANGLIASKIAALAKRS